MSRYTHLDYRGEHDPDSIRVQTDVDDYRPAREDEIEHCDKCGSPALRGTLGRHLGERRCVDCQFLCQVCLEAPVYEPEHICWHCSHWAMGVEV